MKKSAKLFNKNESINKKQEFFFNFSNRQFNKYEIEILNMGGRMIFDVTDQQWDTIKRDFNDFARRIRIKTYSSFNF